jgi:hypothetical protein
MADTAGVFERGVDYRKKFINKYSRKTDMPSVKFLGVKFHPTMPDHLIILSSITMSAQRKINTLIPLELLDDLDREINHKYLRLAQDEHIKINKPGNL